MAIIAARNGNAKLQSKALHLFYLLGESRSMQFESDLLNALVQHEALSKTQKTQTLKFI